MVRGATKIPVSILTSLVFLLSNFCPLALANPLYSNNLQHMSVVASTDTASVPSHNPGPIGTEGGKCSAQTFLLTADLNVYDVPLRYRPPVGPEMIFRVNYIGTGNSNQTNSVTSAPPTNRLPDRGRAIYEPSDDGGSGPTIISIGPTNKTSNTGPKDVNVNSNLASGANNSIGQPFSNLGPGWSFNWVAYLTLDTSKNAQVMVPGGGEETYVFNGARNEHNPYLPNLTSHAVLAIAGDGIYQRRLSDGSIEVYNLPDSNGRILLTQVIDPQGNIVRIKYDGNFRISTITDAIGQETRVTHISDNVGDAGFYKITRITDPFGRGAKFAYDENKIHIVSITDTIGLVSQLNYEPGTSNISSMTTPYGTTSFQHYIPPGSPPGSKGLRFTHTDGSMSAIENWAGNVKQTYQWSREALELYPLDPSNGIHSHCTTTQWLTDATGEQIPVEAYVKTPLQNAIAYTYDGQTENSFAGTSNLPIQVTRQVRIVNPDGTSSSGKQTYKYKYNSQARITQEIDPIGRTFSYKYADNNIDLLEMRQTRGTNNDLIAKWEYNDKHLATLFVDGSGQRTRYDYNNFGELTKLTDANNNPWTAEYDSKGYLSKIVGPLPENHYLAKFTYDNCGRRLTHTTAAGHTFTFSYDNADRLTAVTYDDGLSELIKYDRLDAVSFKDRAGRETKRTYDKLDQLISVEDALGRKSLYTWCHCGSLRKMTDPVGHKTNWEHDLEGRIVGKTYADGTEVRYQYERGGDRIQSRTDALNQTANYTYNLDDTLAQITYKNTINPTSPLTATYDQNYLVVATLQNNLGSIKYEYNNYPIDSSITTGAGRLRAVSNSAIPNSTINYNYDELGRTTQCSIDGSNNTDKCTYDVLGRITSEQNTLGNFRYNYGGSSSGNINNTMQLSSITYPNGLVSKFSYEGIFGEERLREIKNIDRNSRTISLFDYGYNTTGAVIKWKQQYEGETEAQYNFTYDPVGQLKDAVNDVAQRMPNHLSYHYEYDLASNRTVIHAQDQVSRVAFNNMNEMIGRHTKEMDKGEKRDEKKAATATPIKFIYDLNGNLLNDGRNEYKWDAENRLIQTDYPGKANHSQFIYNAAGECSRIVETDGRITKVKQLIWCGNQICEDRDEGGIVVTKLFPFGESTMGKNFFFTRDHLGSTREVTDSSGSVQSRLDYDPFGQPKILQGDLLPALQYAGYYRHSPSGLNLTLFRAYNSQLGRWISRDPIGEFGMQGSPDFNPGKFESIASNLYTYVGNNSLNLVDPLGLQAQQKACPPAQNQKTGRLFSRLGTGQQSAVFGQSTAGSGFYAQTSGAASGQLHTTFNQNSGAAPAPANQTGFQSRTGQINQFNSNSPGGSVTFTQGAPQNPGVNYTKDPGILPTSATGPFNPNSGQGGNYNDPNHQRFTGVQSSNVQVMNP